MKRSNNGNESAWMAKWQHTHTLTHQTEKRQNTSQNMHRLNFGVSTVKE